MKELTTAGENAAPTPIGPVTATVPVPSEHILAHGVGRETHWRNPATDPVAPPEPTARR